MNTLFTPKTNRLHANVLLALALLASIVNAQAACTDNGDATFTCTGTSNNTDTTLTGTVILDSSGGAATLNNTTSDINVTQSVLTNSATTVGPWSNITVTGSNAVTINNNVDSQISLDTTFDINELPARAFDPALWGFDALTNKLTNNGVEVGIAANISAINSTPSLTINTFGQVYNTAGEFSYGVYTNAASLDLTVQDGASFPSVASFGNGLTTINLLPNATIGGDILAVDRNPLLTGALAADPSLAITYTASDVGVRNSQINNAGTIGGNIILGTGAHEIINTGFITGITVDQSDTDPLLAAGARTFTLTNTSGSVSSINLNDVAGAVNTINYTTDTGGGFIPTVNANGLGNNTMNVDCMATLCGMNGLSGFSSFNLTGNNTQLVAFSGFSVAGDMNLNASSMTLLGNLSASNVNIGTTTTLIAGSDNSISGNLNSAGNIDLGLHTVTVSGDTLLSGSQIMTSIGNDGSQQTINGKLDTVGTATFSNSVTVVPTVQANTQIFDGQKFVIATHVNALSPATVQQTDTSGFIKWAVNESNGDLILVADIGVPALIKPRLSTAAYNALDAAFSPVGNGLQGALQAELLALHGQDLVSAAERLRPETNDGALRLVLSNTDRVFGMLDNRLLNSYLAKAKNDAKDTSAITDNTLTNGKGIWVQGFGDRGSQKGFDQADGYSVSAAGIAMGADRELDVYNGNASLGLAFSYARGNITNSSNTTNNRIDTNSYLATVYGSRNWEDFYLNAAVGVGRNTYDTHRHLTTHTATGQHDSWQFSSRLAAGWPLMYNDNVTFVPMAGLDYSHIKESGYSENGNELLPVYDPITLSPILNSYAEQSSPINLAIESRSFDSIRSGLGGKAIYSWQQLDWGAELELHGLYRHEFGNLAQDSVARFAAGGKSFTSPGLNPVRDDFMLGGSLRLTGEDENDQITFLTSYDATIREKYFGQTMSLNLRYDFDQAPNYRKEAKAKLATVATKTNAEQKVNATEQDIAEIQKAMQAELVVSATNPVDAEKQKAIDSTLKIWATALSNKNLEAYFNSYAADFETPDGSTRQQWERKRKFELSKEDNPAIKISHLTIEPNGDQALAIFTQSVGADAKQISVRKIVDLANRNGRWLIVREDSMAKTQ